MGQGGRGNFGGRIDQAQGLRQLEIRSTARKQGGVARVISFTSGKGGVGKTSSVVNLALSLGRMGRRVLVLDADLGLANVDVMLGLKVEHTLQDVFEGYRSLREILVDGPEGVTIIPAASGVEALCNLDTEQRMLLADAVEEIGQEYDYLLIDTRAGISPDVMYFNSAASEVVCVINSEPTSLTDAYAAIKVLSRNYGERSISILSNNVSCQEEGMAAFNKLARAVNRFLHINLKYLGFIPADESVRASVLEQRAVTEVYPSCAASLAYAGLARRIDEQFWERRVKGGMQFFFRQLMEAGAPS